MQATLYLWLLPGRTAPPGYRFSGVVSRYKCLGNAVTVNVAEWLGRRVAPFFAEGGAA